MKKKNKITEKEVREVQVKILANMVFKYQGSDPEVHKRQVGVDSAAFTLQEIIDDALQAKEKEVVKEVIKLIKEAEECGDQYGMLYEMIKIHFKKGKK